MPSIGLSLSFFIDGLSLLFLLLITGIGTFIVLYASNYLKGHTDEGRFFFWLFLFMMAMLGLVASDNLLALFVFWELTSITSYMLIGFHHESEKSRKLALQGTVHYRRRRPFVDDRFHYARQPGRYLSVVRNCPALY